MSVCTVMYNHLGSSGFPGFCGMLHSLGIFEVTTREVAQTVLQQVSRASHLKCHAVSLINTHCMYGCLRG